MFSSIHLVLKGIEVYVYNDKITVFYLMYICAKLCCNKHVKMKKQQLTLRYNKLYLVVRKNIFPVKHNKLLTIWSYKQVLMLVWTYHKSSIQHGVSPHKIIFNLILYRYIRRQKRTKSFELVWYE